MRGKKKNMKNNKKILAYCIILSLFAGAVSAGFVSYNPSPKQYVYDTAKDWKWSDGYNDVRKQQRLTILGGATKIMPTPVLKKEPKHINSVVFQNCGVEKFYDIQNKQECMSLGTQHCNNKCALRAVKNCDLCNKRTLTSCLKSFVSQCNILFAKRNGEVGVYYWGGNN